MTINYGRQDVVVLQNLLQKVNIPVRSGNKLQNTSS